MKKSEVIAIANSPAACKSQCSPLEEPSTFNPHHFPGLHQLPRTKQTAGRPGRRNKFRKWTQTCCRFRQPLLYESPLALTPSKSPRNERNILCQTEDTLLGWRNGRRVRLRGVWGNLWGFESPPEHPFSPDFGISLRLREPLTIDHPGRLIKGRRLRFFSC